MTPAAEADDLRRLNAATAHLEPPFAVIDLAAFRSNAADMTRRAGGTPIRLASKSVRCRRLTDDALELDGFRGVLAFTLPEALWLAECRTSDDIVVAYPTADTDALARLAADPAAAMAITVMVDSVGHLDLVARAAATVPDPHPVRVAIDIDAGYQALAGQLRVGARRSPVRVPAQAAALARAITTRPGLRLATAAAPARSRRRRPRMRSPRSARVPGCTSRACSTPTGRFSGRPAALFALPVVRRPGPGVVTVLGGGYMASGPGDPSRLPRPHRPAGLTLDGSEGACEVQTTVLGAAADDLRIGDRVWFRHAKAGELCERFNELHLIDGGAVTATVPTYRGEGKAFR